MSVAATAGIGEMPPIPRERSVASSLEIVFPQTTRARLAQPWSAPPGTVLRVGTQIVALNFAPTRWLLLDADATLRSSAADTGAVTIDVDGKWRCFEVSGSRAEALLSSSVNVAMVLENRDCAAVSLFDCPAVIARCSRDDQFAICVHASYATSLLVALESARQRLAQP